jgi:sulfur carrier protein ThiS
VLRADGLRPDAVVVLRGPTPIPITETVADGEELQVLEVVSGG